MYIQYKRCMGLKDAWCGVSSAVVNKQAATYPTHKKRKCYSP